MLGSARAALFGASDPIGGGPPYTAQGVRFDGTNDELLRGADLTGNADGKEFTLSCWINILGNDLAIMGILNSLVNSFSFHRHIDDKIRVQAFDNGTATWLTATDRLFNSTTNTGWHHVLIALNAVTPIGQFYMDDAVEPTTDIDAPNDRLINFTVTEWSVGGEAAGAGFILDAELADLWFDLNYMDISVESNRRKFIDGAGKPVDLGATGGTPTGSDPIAYFSRETVNWHTNKGTGGGFTEIGALTDAASSPSD